MRTVASSSIASKDRRLWVRRHLAEQSQQGAQRREVRDRFPRDAFSQQEAYLLDIEALTLGANIC
jgi:hypothetical protein